MEPEMSCEYLKQKDSFLGLNHASESIFGILLKCLIDLTFLCNKGKSYFRDVLLKAFGDYNFYF